MQDVAGYHNIQSLLGFPRIFLFISHFQKSTPRSRNLANIPGVERCLTPTIWHHLLGVYSPLSSQHWWWSGWREHFPSLSASPPQPGDDLWWRWEKDKDKTSQWRALEFKIFPSDIWASRISFCWAEYLLSGFSLTVDCGCFLILLTSSSCIEITSCSKIRAGRGPPTVSTSAETTTLTQSGTTDYTLDTTPDCAPMLILNVKGWRYCCPVP